MYVVQVMAGFDSEEEKERVLSELKTAFPHEEPNQNETFFDITLYAESGVGSDISNEIMNMLDRDKVTEGHIDIYGQIEHSEIHRD
jgi:hypothetical protein